MCKSISFVSYLQFMFNILTEKYYLEGLLIVSVSIHIHLIMNYGTILQQNSRGSAYNEFHNSCLHLFYY